MAKGQKVDELYISLGLDINQLNLDFETAGKTVSQSISRLNSESKKIRLRTDIDLANLEGAGSELDKLRRKEEGINQLLQVQTQKLAILKAAYQSAQANYGNDHGLTQRAGTNYLQQQREVAQLTAELHKLHIAEHEAAQGGVGNVGKDAKAAAADLLAMSGGVGSVSIAFRALSALGPAGIIAGIGLAMAGATIKVTEMAKTAMDAGDNIYRMSKRLNMSTGEAAQFGKLFKLAGVDVQSAIPSFMRLDKQVMSTGESGTAAQRMLEKFGVSLTNANGALLPYNEQLANLAAGYEKASKAGEAEDYVTQTLGARGMELIPILEDYGRLMKDSADTPGTGMLNVEECEELKRSWRQMDYEMNQVKMTISAAMVPAANEIIPEVRDELAKCVKVIADNKDGIKELVSLFGKLAEAAAMAAKAAGGVAGAAGLTAKNVSGSLGLANYEAKNDLPALTGKLSATALMGVGLLTVDPLLIGAGVAMGGGTLIYESLQNDKGKYDSQKSQSDSDKQEAARHRQIGESIRQIDYQTAQQKEAAAQKAKAQADAQQKADDIMFHSTHNRLENEIYDIDRQAEDEIKKTHDKESAYVKAEAAKAAARKKAVEEIAALDSNTDNQTFGLTHNELQTNLHNVDVQMESMRQQYKDLGLSAESEQKIEEYGAAAKAKIMQDFERNTVSQIDSIWKSEYQNRMDEIEREKIAWHDKGVDEVKYTEWAEEKKRQVQADFALRMFKEQRKYLEIYRKAMAGQMTGFDDKNLATYDFSASLEKRMAAAQAGIAAVMRKEYGISDVDFTTPGEMTGFSQAMGAAKNNIVPIYADGQIPQVPMMIRGGVNNYDMTAPGVYQAMQQPSHLVENPNYKDPAANPAPQTGNKVNINVNIENAVTQDNEGMRKLADNVADHINREIKNVLGSSNNSY